MTRYNRDYFFGASGTKYTKFSTQNRPTQFMFSNLFGSIAFLSEKDDTGTTSKQGLTKLSTDANAIARNSSMDADGFAKVIQAHHIPDVVAVGEDNALTVTVVTTEEGRTGGEGQRYTIENTLAVTSASDLVTVTQANPGEDVVIDVDMDEFNTAVSSSASFQALEATVEESVSTLVTGKIGEIKMYSFFNEALGDTNCEFDADGIGRAAGVEGATGQWVGWIALLGQEAVDIVGADANILNRYKVDATYLVDTTEKYPSGLGRAPSEPNAGVGFGNVGSNKFTMTSAESYLKLHTHTVNVTLEAHEGHAHKIAYKGASGEDNPGKSVLNIHTQKDLISEGTTYKTYHYTGSVIKAAYNDPQAGYLYHAVAEPDGNNPIDFWFELEGGHNHEVDVNSSTEVSIPTEQHENRPNTFMTAFCVYVGAAGSTN